MATAPPIGGRKKVTGPGFHQHPTNKANHIYGIVLGPSDSVQAGDHFSSDSGQWMECPKFWAGLMVSNFSSTMIVRIVKAT